MSYRRLSAWALATVIAIRAVAGQGTTPAPSPSVGMTAELRQVILPGPELEVKPIDDLKTPLVVRILEVYPHGSAFRYDLSYYGLKPGTYDLGSFLQRKDGQPSTGLPEIPVTIASVLPPGQVEPHAVPAPAPPSLGGYRTLVLVGAMLWSAILVWILYVTRRIPEPMAAAGARPVTLAEQLHPLVESAVRGDLDPARHAELERLLLGFWRRRLGLEDRDAAAAIRELKAHPEAGPAVRFLEDWLHKPGGLGEVDVAGFLAPYRDVIGENAPVRLASASARVAAVNMGASL